MGVAKKIYNVIFQFPSPKLISVIITVTMAENTSKNLFKNNRIAFAEMLFNGAFQLSFTMTVSISLLFHLIHQFLSVLEVAYVLECRYGDVTGCLASEKCLVRGHDDIGHHQQQSQLVVVNHTI